MRMLEENLNNGLYENLWGKLGVKYPRDRLKIDLK